MAELGENTQGRGGLHRATSWTRRAGFNSGAQNISGDALAVVNASRCSVNHVCYLQGREGGPGNDAAFCRFIAEGEKEVIHTAVAVTWYPQE